jgi:hypothetical protein
MSLLSLLYFLLFYKLFPGFQWKKQMGMGKTAQSRTLTEARYGLEEQELSATTSFFYFYFLFFVFSKIIKIIKKEIHKYNRITECESTPSHSSHCLIWLFVSAATVTLLQTYFTSQTIATHSRPTMYAFVLDFDILKFGHTAIPATKTIPLFSLVNVLLKKIL